MLGLERVSEIFAYLDDVEEYIEELPNEKAADIIENMDADDAVDVLEELESDKKEEIIIHKDANYKELEKKYNELKNENYELGLALEGLRREIKLYKNEKIANIINNTDISKE